MGMSVLSASVMSDQQKLRGATSAASPLAASTRNPPPVLTAMKLNGILIARAPFFLHVV